MEALVARSGGTVLDAAADSLSRESRIKDWVVAGPKLLAPIRPPSLATEDCRWLFGPGGELPTPPAHGTLTFDLELAAVVRCEARGLKVREAAECIFGYTLMAYWSCGGEFAAAIGPSVVTADEFDPLHVTVTSRVNGRLWAQGRMKPRRTFAQIVAAASRQDQIAPGDVFGAGTLGDRRQRVRSPRAGSRITIEAEGIGTLEFQMGKREKRRAAS